VLLSFLKKTNNEHLKPQSAPRVTATRVPRICAAPRAAVVRFRGHAPRAAGLCARAGASARACALRLCNARHAGFAQR
jgi:hypothetical protein